MKNLIALLFAALWMLAGTANAGINLFLEDFESGSGNITATNGSTFGSDGDQDYFDIVNNLNTDRSYTNVQGTNYFGAQDVDDSDAAGVNPATMEIQGINVSGFSSLSFSAFFAEQGPEAGGDNDIDALDFFVAEFQIDGGGFQNLIAFRNDGTPSNTTFLEDTDFNGIGDGTQLTTNFAQFTKAIAGVGSTLDLRFTFALNSGDEDLAIDSIAIEGQPEVIPEPVTAVSFIVGLGLISRRRR